MNFEEFKRHFKEGTLKEDTYSFSTEKDLWQWEEAETLKKHYEEIKGQWMDKVAIRVPSPVDRILGVKDAM